MIRVNVPCNGCTACCRTTVVLLPEYGDDPSAYHTVPLAHLDPNTAPKLMRDVGKNVADIGALAKKPNGECIYLGAGGCTIWDRAPHMCQIYDCRAWYKSLNRADRRRLLSRGDNVVKAAKARLSGPI